MFAGTGIVTLRPVSEVRVNRNPARAGYGQGHPEEAAMRRNRIRTMVVLALIAGTGLLGVPHARAATFDLNEVAGECSTLGPLVGGRSEDGSAVVRERRRDDGSLLNAGEADAWQRRAGGFAQIRSTSDATSEYCTETSATVTRVRVDPGTSGLALGTPVDVVVDLRMGNVLTHAFPDTFSGSGEARFDLYASIHDLAFTQSAQGRLLALSIDGRLQVRAGSDLRWGYGHSTSVQRGDEPPTSTASGDGGVLCVSWPAGCSVRDRALSVPAPEPVTVRTRVGASLELSVDLDVTTSVVGGPVTTTSDVYGGDGSTEGIVVDLAPQGAAAGLSLVPGADYENHPPVAIEQTVTSDGSPADVQLEATDEDGDPLDFYAYDPVNGTVSLAGSIATFTPDPGFVGQAQFTFAAEDPRSEFDEALILVDVGGDAGNRPPVAEPAEASTPEDKPVDITLVASDPDGDPLTYVIDTPPGRGTVTISGDVARYEPSPDLHGSDSFTYAATDGTDASEPETVSIDVQPVNDPPVPQPQRVEVLEDGSRTITMVATDADGDGLGYEIVVPPRHGELLRFLPSGTIDYRPFADYTGPDLFTFAVTDGIERAGPVDVDITVVPMFDPPVALDGAAWTPEDHAVRLQLQATNPDGGALTFEITRDPGLGWLSATSDPHEFIYVPFADRNGTDTFEFVARDERRVVSEPARFSVEVAPVNDSPRTSPDTAVVELPAPAGGITIDVLANDVDVDAGDTFRVVEVTQPPHGAANATPDGRGVTFHPQSDWYGTTGFSYVVEDSSGERSFAAWVLIEVRPRTIAVTGPATLGEGGTAEYLVRLSSASPVTVRVNVRTEPGTATAGRDYRPLSRTVEFRPGETVSPLLAVPTIFDGLREPDERFSVVLLLAQGARIGGGTVTTTIRANDT